MSYKVRVVWLSLNVRTLIEKRKRNTNLNLSILYPQLITYMVALYVFFCFIYLYDGLTWKTCDVFLSSFSCMGPLLNGCSTHVDYLQAFCCFVFINIPHSAHVEHLRCMNSTQFFFWLTINKYLLNSCNIHCIMLSLHCPPIYACTKHILNCMCSVIVLHNCLAYHS